MMMTLAVATNGRIDYSAFEKGDGKMCTLFEEIARENKIKGIEKGRAEGRVEGRAEGRAEGKAEGIIEAGFDFGLSEKDILEMLQTKLEISLQMAQEYLLRFGKQNV